jgi:hypothetical protein
MGLFLDSLSVRTGDGPSVRSLISNWMSAKGFELRPDAPLFPFSEWEAVMGSESGASDERGFFLLWNAQWTVALFSHMTTEGPRLLFELGRTKHPVLKTWVHDSDLWGYELHREGELLAAFNSNPRYFGAEEPPALSQNGDPVLVCQVCGLATLETEIATLQRGRAVFIDGICRRFCTVIGAAAAGYGYRDLKEHGLDVPLPRTIGEFQVEHLYFVRRGLRPEPPPDLHRLPIRPPPPPEEPPSQSLELPPEYRLWAWLFRGIGWLIWFVAFLLRPLFWLLFRLFGPALLRRMTATESAGAGDPFLHALEAAQRQSVRVEGRHLIHDRHGCRVTLPDGVEQRPPIGGVGVFHFSVLGQIAFCEAVRPGQIEERFKLFPGVIVTEDENFFVGPLPARRLVRQTIGQQWTMTQHLIVVQAPRAFYCFWLGHWPGREALPPEAPTKLRELADSFTLLDEMEPR